MRTERLNTKTFRKFLQHLLRTFGKVYVITDNAIYHKAKALRPFLRRHRGRLSVHFIPPYSPELNPVEMLWRETRKDATHNRYFPTLKRLSRAVQTQFRIYQHQPHRLRGAVAPFL